jgi:hypothetical protein
MGAELTRPPVGGIASGTLPSGWPIWLVTHDDGRTSVLSAVVPRPKPGPLGMTVELVTWLPSTRLFIGAGLVYDEHGKALGYQAFDGCINDCPRIEDQAKEGHDLDAWILAAAGPGPADGGALVLAAPSPGALRPLATTWVQFLPAKRTPVEVAPLFTAPQPPVTIEAALATPLGNYAVIDGEILRQSDAPPELCSRPAPPTDACAPCAGGGAPIGGVESLEGQKGNFRRVEQGTFLVRHEAQGLVLVGGNIRGECSTAL